jgi:hypothetical protein
MVHIEAGVGVCRSGFGRHFAAFAAVGLKADLLLRHSGRGGPRNNARSDGPPSIGQTGLAAV